MVDMPAVELPKALCVARPDPRVPWMAGGLGAFFPRLTAAGHLEILVSGRDSDGRSRIGAMTYEWGDPPRLLDIGEPLLDMGDLGCFDMDGAGYPWLVETGGVQRMFYVGWMKLGGTVPFRNQLGLAQRTADGERFRRVSRASWFPATDREPVGTGSCSVDRLADGRWRMIYTNFERWEVAGSGAVHRYNLRRAFSEDGLHFDRDGSAVMVDLADREVAIGTPVPRAVAGREELLFTARIDRYRLYASPIEAGLAVPERTLLRIPAGDFDSETQAYPKLLVADGAEWLLYAGNGYGRAGIGMVPLPRGPLSRGPGAEG